MACFGVLLLPAPSLALLSPVKPKLDLYEGIGWNTGRQTRIIVVSVVVEVAALLLDSISGCAILTLGYNITDLPLVSVIVAYHSCCVILAEQCVVNSSVMKD